MRQRSSRYSPTGRIITQFFPMFELTLDGLDEAIKAIIRPTRALVTANEIQQIINHRNRPYARYY